jgi:hypothetical protein
MSILLSETDIAHLLADDDAYIETGEYDIDFMCKAQAIHTVKYIESPCTEHLYNDTFVSQNYHRHRYDCEICMAEIHKELGMLKEPRHLKSMPNKLPKNWQGRILK